MPKQYTSLKQTEKALKGFIADTGGEFTGMLTEEFLKDSNAPGVAPKQDGTLINTSILATNYKEGIIYYTPPYASRRYYEGSITGEKEWLKKNKQRNIKRYLALIVKYFEKRKRG